MVVDFWAEWCGPCKMIAPILDEVASAYEGKLQIAKMNVDDNRDIPAKFGIRGIPHPHDLQRRPTRGHQSGRHEQVPTDRFHRPAAGLMLRCRPAEPVVSSTNRA